MYRVKHVAVIG